MMRPLVRDGGERRREYATKRARADMTIRERLALHIATDTNGCWVWTLSPDDAGYGRITINGRGGYYAHRVSYEEFVGAVPTGLQLDHLCRNRRCCNPDHLEPVTPAVNTRRGHHPNVLATHCPRGHEYDSANTYTYKGHRACKTCRAVYRREYAAMTRGQIEKRLGLGLPAVDLDAYFARLDAEAGAA